ncbi:MAG TPA: glutathione S-transferase family protein [Rhizomicrobium sp.]|jgi:glutathione S-transferase|nr:glutathione S-transferase family protein [Rhizomicrobium sp.]
MALTIYGSTDSRTMRVLWAANELGLTFAHVPYDWNDPVLKSPAYLRINPAGAIPAIDDDGFVLSESLAIILYLAKKYGAPPLYPATLAGEAELWRWTLWAQVHLEPWVQGDRLFQRVRAAAEDFIRPHLEKSCSLLEAQLAGRPWILGADFTAADLTVAAVLSPSRAAKLPLGRFPRLRDWHLRCYHRPAALATRGPHPADADPNWPEAPP